MDLKKMLSGVLDQTRTAGHQLRDGLTSIRKRVNEIKAQKAEIEAIPCDEATAHARVDELVDHLVLASQQGRGIAANTMTVIASPQQFDGFPHVNGETTLLKYLAPALKEAMKADATRALKQHPGITETERATRLAKIDRELLDAEMAEESIVRTAEASGFPVARRGNADPRAVLAHDKALP